MVLRDVKQGFSTFRCFIMKLSNMPKKIRGKDEKKALLNSPFKVSNPKTLVMVT